MRRARGPRHATRPRTSQVGEIAVHDNHAFYDFEAKYLAEADVDLSCPADVPAEVSDEVRRLAAAAFESLGLRGARPRRLLLHRRGPRARQRDQHDAGLHPDVDVPADVGRLRARPTPSSSTSCSSSRSSVAPACADSRPGGPARRHEQRRPFSGSEPATAVKAGSSNGHRTVRLRCEHLDGGVAAVGRGDRPVAEGPHHPVDPSTVTQSSVVGPRASSPHRAMTAGSPHAETDPSGGSVSIARQGADARRATGPCAQTGAPDGRRQCHLSARSSTPRAARRRRRASPSWWCGSRAVVVLRRGRPCRSGCG